jgi:ketosteroid isomerase-like protein
MPDSQQQVLAANAAFYAAVAARDVAAMEAVWARRDEVTCIHPGWDLLAGRERVMASWRAILARPDTPMVRPVVRVAVVAGAAAYVICGEAVEGRATGLVATNTFVREDGGWRMIHHHSGPVARPIGAEVDDEDDDGGPPTLN